MHRSLRLVFALAAATLQTAIAQDATPKEITVANPMGIHTWFIIVAVGSLLAWSISYTLELHKELIERRKGREALLTEKERLLDRAADLEAKKETGQLSEAQFKQQMKDVRHRLGAVLEKLGK